MAEFPSPPFPPVERPTVTPNKAPSRTREALPWLPSKPNSMYWLTACKACGHARHWHGASGLIRAGAMLGIKCERKHDGLAACDCTGFVEALQHVRALFSDV